MVTIQDEKKKKKSRVGENNLYTIAFIESLEAKNTTETTKKRICVCVFTHTNLTNPAFIYLRKGMARSHEGLCITLIIINQ